MTQIIHAPTVSRRLAQAGLTRSTALPSRIRGYTRYTRGFEVKLERPRGVAPSPKDTATVKFILGSQPIQGDTSELIEATVAKYIEALAPYYTVTRDPEHCTVVIVFPKEGD